MFKKGSQSTFVYKGLARWDQQGFTDKGYIPPANWVESPPFDAMIEGANANHILADKAYASEKNRGRLQGENYAIKIQQSQKSNYYAEVFEIANLVDDAPLNFARMEERRYGVSKSFKSIHRHFAVNSIKMDNRIDGLHAAFTPFFEFRQQPDP